MATSAAVIAFTFAGAAAALAQGVHAHPIPAIPAELLNRPIAARAGMGRAHDQVSTSSAEAQRAYDQGLVALHAYEWIDAARAFSQALRADPQLAVAHAELSIAYAELNQPALAKTAIDRAKALSERANAHDRRHIDARVAQMAAEAAPADRARLQAYRQTLDAALAAQPGDAELLMLRGIAESPDPADRGQGSVMSAVAYFDKALAAGATSAHHYLTHAYENSGRTADALTHAEAWARAAPAAPHALHMHGHVLRRAGRIDQAIAAFEAADKAEAEYRTREKIPAGVAWHDEHNLDLLASSYRYVGQMTAAERRLKAAFDLPSALLVQMYNKRAWPEFLISRGRFDEAIAAAGVLIANPAALVRATGHIEAGLAHLAAGRVNPAIEQSNLALAALRSASDGQALVAPALQQLQGALFLRTGQRERGRTMLRDLARRMRALPGPDNWVQTLFVLEALFSSARAAGDQELSAWCAAEMLSHDPNYAGSHYAAALAAEARGDSAASRREFGEAARLWAKADAALPERVRSLTP